MEQKVDATFTTELKQHTHQLPGSRAGLPYHQEYHFHHVACFSNSTPRVPYQQGSTKSHPPPRLTPPQNHDRIIDTLLSMTESWISQINRASVTMEQCSNLQNPHSSRCKCGITNQHSMILVNTTVEAACAIQ